MPPASSPLQSLLRCFVLRLALLLGGVLAGREQRMRARVAAMPLHHRHRARLLRELARIAWVRAALADPGFGEDPRTVGKATEVARCVNDAGRRAVARRPLWIARRRAARAASPRLAEVRGGILAERCSRSIAALK